MTCPPIWTSGSAQHTFTPYLHHNGLLAVVEGNRDGWRYAGKLTPITAQDCPSRAFIAFVRGCLGSLVRGELAVIAA